MPLNQYSEFERRQAALEQRRKELDLECVRCPKCDSQWFEQVRCARYKADHHIILGQDVPTREGTVPYILLKCVRCGDMLEPRIQHNSRDIASGDYDLFLDTVEGKHDKRPEPEQKAQEEANAVQPEEL